MASEANGLTFGNRPASRAARRPSEIVGDDLFGQRSYMCSPSLPFAPLRPPTVSWAGSSVLYLLSASVHLDPNPEPSCLNHRQVPLGLLSNKVAQPPK